MSLFDDFIDTLTPWDTEREKRRNQSIASNTANVARNRATLQKYARQGGARGRRASQALRTKPQTFTPQPRFNQSDALISSFAQSIPSVARGTRDLGVAFAREFPRWGTRLGLQTGVLGGDDQGEVKPLGTANPISRFALGTEPVKTSPRDAQEEFADPLTGGDRKNPFNRPLAVGATALDYTPAAGLLKGFVKAGVKTGVKAGTKATTEKATAKTAVEDIAEVGEEAGAVKANQPKPQRGLLADQRGSAQVPSRRGQNLSRSSLNTTTSRGTTEAPTLSNRLNRVVRELADNEVGAVGKNVNPKASLKAPKRADVKLEDFSKTTKFTPEETALIKTARANGVSREEAEALVRTARGQADSPEAKLQKRLDDSLESPAVSNARGQSLSKYRTSREFEDAVVTKQKSLSQPKAQKAMDTAIRELADPRRIERKIDLQRARQLKSKGGLKGRSLRDFTGQRELTPDRQIAHLRGIVENPGLAAKNLDKTKYRVGNVKGSLEDITKIYGTKNSPKAKAFETYRVYKDQLERITFGERNTLGVDPEAMAKYVARYEAVNPEAIIHNAILRQISLRNLAKRIEAGIDDPRLLDYALQRKYYNPRRQVSPEDQIRPSLSGGVRSGAKTTKGRQLSSGGPSESPLDLFFIDNADTIKGLADQTIGSIYRDLARQGASFRGTQFKELVNAETVKKHKDALGEMRKIHETLNKLSTARRAVKTKGKQATAKSKSAQASVKANEERAVRLVKDRLRVIAGIDEKAPKSVDKGIIKKRIDTNYNRILKNSLDENGRPINQTKTLSQVKAEARQLAEERVGKSTIGSTQAFGDVAKEVNSLSRQSALQIFDAMARNDEKALASALKSLNKSKGASDDMTKVVTQLKDDYQELSSAIRNVNQERVGVTNEVRATQQNLDTGEQTYTYRFQGEQGKIRIPIEVAQELDARNKALTKSLTDQGLNAAANAQKIWWTGFLAPVFKTWNILVKNPVLAGLNAPGLSGVGFNAGKSVIKQAFMTKKSRALMKDFQDRGMSYENLLQSRNIYRESADEVAKRANLITFFNRNPVDTLGDVWKGLQQGLATFDNVQRKAVAEGVYKKALRQGYTDEQAKWIGAMAPAKVFGDFNRVSLLARNMEALIPYTGALQSGSRALREAYRARPAETAMKTSILIGGMGALTGYSLSNASEYFKDMKDQDKEYLLDNNWVIALPGASKNADGEWDGIINVPITPDLRPLNRAVREAMLEMGDRKFPNVAALGYEVFNAYTGDVTGSIYDENAVRRADGNKLAGVFAGSAIGSASKIIGGLDPMSLKPLADEFISGKPRTEQATEYTSDVAKRISQVVGGFLTPQQVDAFLTRAGKSGDIVQDKEGGRLEIFGQNFLKDFKPGTSASGGANFYKDKDEVGKTLQNEDDFRFFQSLFAKNSVKSAEDGAARAQELLARPKVLEANEKIDKRKRARGELGDPFFDLTPDQQQRVLRYRASKDLNSAKQAYDKNGNPLFTSLGLDENWYNGKGGYKDKEDTYYDELGKNQKKDLAKKKAELSKLNNKDSQQGQMLKRDIAQLEGNIDSQILTFSGAKKPDNPAMERLQEQYHTLPKGTGARSDFLSANPKLLEYWAEGDRFTQAERVALGLKVGGEEGFGDSDGGSGFSRFSRGGKGGSFSTSSSLSDILEAATSTQSPTLASFKKPTIKGGVPKPKTKKIKAPAIKNKSLKVKKL